MSNKKTSIKYIAGKKLEKLENYAIKSDVFVKLGSMIYKSDIYNFINDTIGGFRNLKIIQEIKKEPIPQHVAIIMDGNRRFARDMGIELNAGHIFGSEKVEELLEWCFELGIKNLTLYAFSTENFRRDPKEVEKLMKLCTEELNKASKDSRIIKNKVKVNVIGRIDLLPKDIQKSVKYIMDKTKNFDKYTLNIALAYGGREEIIHAIQKIAKDVKDNKISIKEINEPKVSSYLYTDGLPDPDLVLRTSGEERISNFLLWQLAYSELYFSDVFWPAFQKRDFLKAIRTCQLRKRRFGK